jgi:hypothetical protein
MTTPDFLAELRRLSSAELEQVGQRSLLDHVVAQAEVVRAKHGPLAGDRLEALLQDPACLRHPVRLVFEFGEMAMHQFGQPDRDWRNGEHDGRVLYLRPMLRDRPELVLLAVAYLIPLINYGDVVTDEVCLAYGAALLGLAPEEFYRRICALAETVGAETRLAGPTDDGPMRFAAPVETTGGCGCGDEGRSARPSRPAGPARDKLPQRPCLL